MLIADIVRAEKERREKIEAEAEAERVAAIDSEYPQEGARGARGGVPLGKIRVSFKY